MKRLALLLCILLLSGRTRANEGPLQLARHFPANTQIYAESDLSALATLDSLLLRFLQPFIAAGDLFSLEESLIAIVPGGLPPTEGAGIYGARVAIGVAQFELATSTQLLALEIRDPTAARQLLEQALAPELASGALRRISQPDGSLRYLTTSVLLGTAYELRADALLIATAASALLTEGAPTLLENERLLAAYANLPAADYEAALLIEGEVLLLRALGEAFVNPTLAKLLPPLGRRWPALISALGDGAFGLRRVGDDGLHQIDLAIRPRPDDAAGFPTIDFTAAPVDTITLELAPQIAAESALALIGSNLGADVDQLIATVAGWSGWLATADALPADLGWLPAIEALLPLALRALTELDLQEDLLAWLRGDYALILADEPPNFTLVSNSADPAATASTFEQLRASLEFYDPATDTFQPPLALPPAWAKSELALQLHIDGALASLKQGPIARLTKMPNTTSDDETKAALLAHRLPGAQLLLYLDGARLATWLEAFDPTLARLDALGQAALSLRWRDGVFALRLLLPGS